MNEETKKTFRDYGKFDFEDHQIEVAEEKYKKVNKEVEESLE